MSYRIQLNPKQNRALEILQNPANRRVFFDGGARSGKTFLVSLFLLWWIQNHYNSKILACRKHYNHIQHTLWPTLKDLLVKAGGFTYTNTHPRTITSTETGSEIVLEGLDSDQRVQKIMGAEYDVVFVNESTQITYSMLCDLETRLSRVSTSLDGSEAKRMEIMDCNPQSQRHWNHMLCVDSLNPMTEEPLLDSERWERLSWTPYDNPNLPPDYLKVLQALPEVKRKRMLNGIWCSNEGSVYDIFDEEIHVFRDTPPGSDQWASVGGIDFGYTNPFVFLHGKVDGDGRLWIFEEYYKRKRTIDEHWAHYLERKIRGTSWNWIVSDHDAEDRAQLERKGVHTRRAVKTVKHGIEAVMARLMPAGDGRSRLMIHESCRELIGELYDYRWADPVPGKAEKEEPVKDRDHAVDALRYVIMQMDGQRGARVLGL